MGGRVYLQSDAVYFLVSSVFYLAVGLYVALGVRSKARATVHLALAFMLAGAFALPYLPGYSIYHPLAAYHRWFTVSTVLLQHPHMAQILYHLPDTRFPRFSRGMLIGQYVMAAVVTAIFVVGSSSRPIIFNFSGHYYDFDANDLSRLVGAAVLFNALHVLVAGVVHALLRKEGRVLAGSLTLAMAFLILPPTVTNILSRDGLLARSIHQTALAFFTSTGFFVVFILFLNSTKDKTTFMIKIIGVSLVTFTVAMVFVTYAMFEDHEEAFDHLHASETARMLTEPSYRPADLNYTVIYQRKSGRLIPRGPATRSEADSSIDISMIRAAFRGRTDAETPVEAAELANQASVLAAGGSHDLALEAVADALTHDANNLKALRLLGRLLAEERRYAEALTHVSAYLTRKPADTEIMYLAAVLQRRLGVMEEAIDFGERVRLRNPDHARNLINLARAHAQVGNHKRCGKIVQEVLVLEPDNSFALRLKKQLEALEASDSTVSPD